MRRGERRLTPEEAALWRLVTQSTRPLRPVMTPPALEGAPQVQAKPPPTPPRPKAPPSQPRVVAPAPPADRSGEKKVRRGQAPIAAVLDLHGHTQDQARRALAAFLHQNQGPQGCVVLVVTGKGGRLVSGEAAPGVLRHRLPDWLAEPAIRPLVAGYASAHQRHGGGGAFYVFLRRRSD